MTDIAESVVNVIAERQALIDDYQRLWYDEGAEKRHTWGSTTYLGIKVWKHPTDMWLYQELINELRPALLIETGTAFGGSALYFAHLMDQLGQGKVLTIDIAPVQKSYPRHPRISFIGGRSSTHMLMLSDAGIAAAQAAQVGPVMVVLDSNHAEKHVLQELRCYSVMVTPGSYLVVEDTEINGHPIDPERGIGPPEGKGPGPYEAVEKWLAEPQNRAFAIDKRGPARMLWSAHTWLRRERT